MRDIFAETFLLAARGTLGSMHTRLDRAHQISYGLLNGQVVDDLFGKVIQGSEVRLHRTETIGNPRYGKRLKAPRYAMIRDVWKTPVSNNHIAEDRVTAKRNSRVVSLSGEIPA